MYHPVGTAALGEVLDSRLRVHGVQVITLRLTLTQKSKNKWVWKVVVLRLTLMLVLMLHGLRAMLLQLLLFPPLLQHC